MRPKYIQQRATACDRLVSRMVEAGWQREDAERIVGKDTDIGRLPESKTMPWSRKRRDIERNGPFNDAQFDRLVAFYGRCLRCGRDDLPLVPDHIIPLFRGGKHDISNVQPLCVPCNMKKGNRMIDYRLEARISESTPIQSEGKALE